MNNVILNDDSVIFQNRYFDIYTGELIAPIETPNYTVVQVAESYYLSKFEIAQHRQICDLEITLPLTNGIECQIDDQTFKMDKGEASLTFLRQSRRLYGKKSVRFQTLAFNFRDGSCSQLRAELERKKAKGISTFTDDISKQMLQIISEFTKEPLPYFALQLDALITEILIILNRSGQTAKLTEFNCTELLPRIINFLDNHYLQADVLSILPTKFGYSYSYICKKFKGAYQCSPAVYLQSKRMEYAKQALRDGMTVTAVAEKLGYSSPFNFSRAYKKHFGAAPTK